MQNIIEHDALTGATTAGTWQIRWKQMERRRRSGHSFVLVDPITSGQRNLRPPPRMRCCAKLAPHDSPVRTDGGALGGEEFQAIMPWTPTLGTRQSG